MQSFSAWLASSNRNAYDLSDAGFFCTGAVLYKQKLVYYKKKYFLENPAKNIVLLQEKKTYNLFPLQCCSKALEIYRFHLAGACNMESEMCLRTTYKRPYILIMHCLSTKVMYSGCGLVQLFLFRIQLCPVRVPVCMCGPAQPPRQTPTLSFVNSTLNFGLALYQQASLWS
jgi:hypothetical protein